MSKISSHQIEKLQNYIIAIPQLQNIITAIASADGTVLLVGGAVRDLLLAKEVKDLDIEVHGISLEKLQKELETFGPVSLVGKSFGVLRLHAIDIDWSLPRTDTAGRKPDVVIDPYMEYKTAFERRDLTMNAMGINLETFELLDPFGGQQDIQDKILRAPNAEFFNQDPLRFFRVMQFIGRFGMHPDEELNNICKVMDISQVSRERIEQECNKLLLRSERPSLAIRWLQEIDRLREIFPELYACIGVDQDTKWHPEGNVFEHSLQTLDAAAFIARTYEDEFQKLVLLYAALCHDVGKPETTECRDGVCTSIGHEAVGVPLAKQMLMRITQNRDLIAAVLKLVAHHLEPGQFITNNASPSAYKRLAKKLAPDVTLSLLADLSLADKRGRNPKGDTPLTSLFEEIELFKQNAQQAQVFQEVEKPVLTGADILDLVEPGPRMGQLLAHAYDIQITEGIVDNDALKKRIKSLLEVGDKF